MAGEDWAWRELVRAIGPSILAYARAQGARDPDDILGEVLVDLVRTVARFRGDLRGFKAWAIRVAHSRIIDQRRRSARRPAVTMPEVPEQPTQDDLSGEVAGSEWVREVLDSLPPLQRDIVLLRVIGGLSVEETARIVGRRPGAVRTAQHRALARLRETLVLKP